MGREREREAEKERSREHQTIPKATAYQRYSKVVAGCSFESSFGGDR
jgi:hypothetical protein